MLKFTPIDKIRNQVNQDRADSDVAFFYSLLCYGEFLTKLVVLGLAAGIAEDRDRHRYAILHQLVRTDGLGDWCKALDQCLTGPASQKLFLSARATQRQLTQRLGPLLASPGAADCYGWPSRTPSVKTMVLRSSPVTIAVSFVREDARFIGDLPRGRRGPELRSRAYSYMTT